MSQSTWLINIMRLEIIIFNELLDENLTIN